jgi:NhaA family Na+:H+ antiporter
LVFDTSSFALANGDIVSSNIGETIAQHYSIGIALGLIVENHWVFISLVFCVSLGICKLPPDMNWKTVIGVGF